MATVIKDLGAVTAYAYAVEGGYTGTEEEFTELLGNIAIDLAEIENLSVTVTTLPAGSQATASYSDGVLSLGIPKGDKGDTGDTGATPAFSIGTVTTEAAGSPASASIAGTAAAPILNLRIPKGADGDVSAASMATAYSTSATYAVGDYVWYSGQLYRCTTAITTAEAWTSGHWTAAKIADDVGGLKSAIDVIDAEIYKMETLSFTTDDFAIGTIKTANGQNDSGAARYRLKSAIYLRAGSTVAGTEKFAVYEYSDSDASSTHYKGVVHSLATDADPFVIPRDNWYRILLAFTDNASITDDNKATLLATLTVKSLKSKLMPRSEGVAYTEQSATDTQKAVARSNIGAAADGDMYVFADMAVPKWRFERIYLSPSGSSMGSSTKRITSHFIFLHKGSTLSVTDSYSFVAYFYDKNRDFVSKSDAASSAVCPQSGFCRIVLMKTDNSTISDADFTAMVAALSVYDKRNPALVPAQMRLVVPEIVPVTSGRQMNFYHQNMMYGANARKADRMTFISNSIDNYATFGRWSPTGSSSGSTATNYVQFFAKNTIDFDTAAAFKIVKPGTDAGSGLTKKVLIIGDSLTGGYSTIRTTFGGLFADDAMSVEMLGTVGTAPYLCEGHSGWGYYSYFHSQSRGEGDATINPFWNPSTSAFDFEYYLTNNSIADPDYVLLCLGTNDGSHTDAEIAECVDGIIESIHDYDADIRIGIWLPPISATLSHGNEGANYTYRIIRLLIDRYSGRQSERIYTIPVFLAVDTEHDYPVEEVNIDARTSAYKMLIPTDNLHPTTAGFEKIADVLFSFVKYLGDLEE